MLIISLFLAVLPMLANAEVPAAAQTGEGEAPDTLALDLKACREMAKEGNATVKNAYLDIEAARHQKMEAFAEYFPSISINSMGFYAINPLVDITMKDVLGSSDLAHNIMNQINQITQPQGMNIGYETLHWGYLAMASVIQPVFAGGRIVNGNRLASLGIEAAQLKTRMTATEQQEEIDKKYWQLVSLDEKERSLQTGEKLVENVWKTVNSAKNAGLALQTDLMQVEKEKNKLRIQRKRLDSGKRLAKMDLLNTIGQPFALLESNAEEGLPFIDKIGFETGLDSLEGPEGLYVDEAEAAQESVESRLLELSVKAAKLQKKMEVGATLPEIGIGFAGGYGKLMGPESQWNGIALAKISIPITDWWKVSHKARRLEIKVKQAENQRDFLQSQLRLKAQMLWEEVACTWEELEIARENVKISEQAYALTAAQFSSGQNTLNELMKASSDLQLSIDEQKNKGTVK